MNKKLIFSATLVMVLALGLALAGCKTDPDDGGGNPIKITGEPKVGSKLTATYDEAATPIWWEYGKDDTINSPPGNTYVIQANDVGKKIRAACLDDSYNEVYSDFVGPVTH
jgi:hypothetical protein